jgi:hypothetical protein
LQGLENDLFTPCLILQNQAFAVPAAHLTAALQSNPVILPNFGASSVGRTDSLIFSACVFSFVFYIFSVFEPNNT